MPTVEGNSDDMFRRRGRCACLCGLCGLCGEESPRANLKTLKKKIKKLRSIGGPVQPTAGLATLVSSPSSFIPRPLRGASKGHPGGTRGSLHWVHMPEGGPDEELIGQCFLKG